MKYIKLFYDIKGKKCLNDVGMCQRQQNITTSRKESKNHMRSTKNGYAL